MKRKTINFKTLLISLFLSLVVVGGGTNLLTSGSIQGYYKTLVKPPLVPPNFVFPIVWTILFVLMGVSAYLIYESSSKSKATALKLYCAQLAFNALWSIVFFNLHNNLVSLIIILILDTLVFFCIKEFSKINKLAGKLMIPYLLWICFATYLNIGIFILNL